MLDVIADFWKPVKKGQSQEKLQPEQLQVGSAIGFGFVPQAMLSGRRLQVSAINTYQFGDEALTSFVLTQERDAGVAMIVAEADGEQWLAISRRVSISDRMRLFDSQDLENVLTRADASRLPCRDNAADFKGWVVASYKREHHKLKGRIFKGDFRKAPLPPAGEGQEFEYTTLVSDSNEHAIEIEKYGDGRIEVYTTVYRRMSDVGEISHPATAGVTRPDIRFDSPETPPTLVVSDSAPVLTRAAAAPETAKAALPETAVPVPPGSVTSTLEQKEKIEAKAIETKEEKTESAIPAAPVTTTSIREEEKSMATMEPAINGTRTDMNTNPESNKSKLYVQSTAPESYMKQEVKAVTNGTLNNFDADSIECDLRVANKIIDEAIRNEMRLTDIVRRIIELPVAYPESVQIPVTLTDEDFALLAIRYGIPSSDRNAIKRRIIDDLNDFSGGKKAA